MNQNKQFELKVLKQTQEDLKLIFGIVILITYLLMFSSIFFWIWGSFLLAAKVFGSGLLAFFVFRGIMRGALNSIKSDIEVLQSQIHFEPKSKFQERLAEYAEQQKTI